MNRPRQHRRAWSRACRRGAPWLALSLMFLCHYAAGGQLEDVQDTHRRLDRIYDKHGIDRGKARSAPIGCNCQTKQLDKNKIPGWFAYMVTGAIVAAMVVPLIMILVASFRSRNPGEYQGGELPEEKETDSVEDPLGPWHVDLSICRRLMEQGRAAEALAALHRLILEALEEANYIALDGTTTNWEFVQQLDSSPGLRRILAQITLAAEQAVLGQSPPERSRYMDLERLVIQGMEEARSR